MPLNVYYTYDFEAYERLSHNQSVISNRPCCSIWSVDRVYQSIVALTAFFPLECLKTYRWIRFRQRRPWQKQRRICQTFLFGIHCILIFPGIYFEFKVISVNFENVKCHWELLIDF